MRLVIGPLADIAAAERLAAVWLERRLPPERLHLLAGAGEAASAGAHGVLERLVTHGPVALLAPREIADGPPTGAKAALARRRRALSLLGRLQIAGELSDGSTRLVELELGRLLGVARLQRDAEASAAMVRPMLACAHAPVRVLDLVAPPRGVPGGDGAPGATRCRPRPSA